MALPSTVYDAIFNDLTLRQIVSTDVAANVQEVIARISGGVDPSLVSVLSAEPQLSFTSADLAGVIGGVNIASGKGVTSSTITIPYQQRSNTAVYASGSNHFNFAATGGLLVITEVSANQDDEAGAQAQLQFTPIWDGTNPILAVAVSQALSAQAFNAAFGLGPFKLNGTQVPKVVGVSVKTGITVGVNRYDGEPYARIAYIKERNPTMEVTFEDMDALNTFSGLFTSISGTAVAYFRRRAAGSTYAANGSGTHSSFTLTGGLSKMDNASAANRDNAQPKLMLHGHTLAASAAANIS